jgi:hypothetical protein
MKIKPALLVYSKGYFEGDQSILFKIRFSRLCFCKLDSEWENYLKDALDKFEIQNYQITKSWTHARLRINFQDEINMLDLKSQLIQFVKECIVEVNNKLHSNARKLNDERLSQKKKIKNLKLLNEQFENKHLNTDEFVEEKGITDKDLIIVISTETQTKNFITLMYLRDYLLANPKNKIVVSIHNLLLYKKIKSVLKIKNLKPVLNISASKKIENNQVLDAKAIMEKRILREQKKDEINKKVLKYLKRIPMASLILVTMGASIFFLINTLLYDNFEIDYLNYSSFVEIEVFIDETPYYLESNDQPLKYIYTINPTFIQLTQTDVTPDLIVNFTDKSGSKEIVLNELTFENTTPISNVLIRVSTDFKESLRFLKSDLNKIDHNKESETYYSIELKQTEFYFKEVSLSIDNFADYLEFIIDNPIDNYRNNVYQRTNYSISIRKINNVYNVADLSLEILYQFSEMGLEYNINNIIEFKLDKLTHTDKIGTYEYFIYEIKTVQGSVVIRESYN